MKNSLIKKCISLFIAFTFSGNFIIPPSYAQVVSTNLINLPNPGTMIATTPAFAPAAMRGLMIYPDNPLKFDFVIDRGDTKMTEDEFKAESTKLVRYFLASLTVPEKDMWVNLSPYEKNRIIPDNFGQTEMGRDLLAQDYILKQLTASLMYPENETGKEFWNKIYAKINERFGLTDIPLNTFNKVWILPDQVSIYEHTKGAFIVKGRLKVMLEEDYVALKENGKEKIEDGQDPSSPVHSPSSSLTATIQSQMVREIIIPEIEREVNEGSIFTQLRQIYYSMILASWYKKALKESLLGKVYVDQNKTEGVDIADKNENQKIYEKYIEAFKQGAYDYVKEDYNAETQEVVTRKYISGGMTLALTEGTNAAMVATKENDPEVNQAMVSLAQKGDIATFELNGGANAAMTAEEVTNFPLNEITLTEKPNDYRSEVEIISNKDKTIIQIDDNKIELEGPHILWISTTERGARRGSDTIITVKATSELVDTILELKPKHSKTTETGIDIDMGPRFYPRNNPQRRTLSFEIANPEILVDGINTKKLKDALNKQRDYIDQTISYEEYSHLLNTIDEFKSFKKIINEIQELMDDILESTSEQGRIVKINDKLNSLIKTKEELDDFYMSDSYYNLKHKFHEMLESSLFHLKDKLFSYEFIKGQIAGSLGNFISELKYLTDIDNAAMTAEKVTTSENTNKLTAALSFEVENVVPELRKEAKKFSNPDDQYPYNNYAGTIEGLKNQIDALLKGISEKNISQMEAKNALGILKRTNTGFKFFLEKYYSSLPTLTKLKSETYNIVALLEVFIRDLDNFVTSSPDGSTDAAMMTEQVADGIKKLVENLQIGEQRTFSFEELTKALASTDPTLATNSGEVQQVVKNIVAGTLNFSQQGFTIEIQPNGVVITRTKVGGIDFNPENLKVNLKKDGDGVQFAPISNEAIQGMNINGFVPVFINVVPATNLPFLLGIKKEDDKENLAYRS